jgi:DNA-binding HxlR family transcriptional regulator
LARGYHQHCALAHALDLIGERWTLLIVRELLPGPRRYGDLARGLVTVPTNVLAARLKDMEAQGLVAKRRLDPPAEQVVVYELTEEGQSLGDVVTALAAWGLRTLPGAPDGAAFRARWLIPVMDARFDADAAEGIEESYELDLEGDEPVHFTVSDGRGKAGTGPAQDPAVVLSADADTLLALADAQITIPEALGKGARIEGEPQAVQRMMRVLPARPAGG